MLISIRFYVDIHTLVLQQSRTPGNAVHKGYLQFSGDGGRNWKKRWFVLNDNNSLYLFKAPQVSSVVDGDTVMFAEMVVLYCK